MAVWVAQLIDNAAEEAQSSLIVELECDLLEKLNALTLNYLRVFWLFALLSAHSCRNIEDYSIDDRGLGHDLAINLLFAGHHLEADIVDQDLAARSKVLVDLISESIKLDVITKVAQDAWVLLVL